MKAGGRFALWCLAATATAFLLTLALQPDEYPPYDIYARNWDRSNEIDWRIQVIDTRSDERTDIAPIISALVRRQDPPRAIGLDFQMEKRSEAENSPIPDDAMVEAIRAAVAQDIPVFLAMRNKGLVYEKFLEAGAVAAIVDVDQDKWSRPRGVVAATAGARPVYGLAARLAPFLLGDDTERGVRLDGERLQVMNGRKSRYLDLEPGPEATLAVAIDFAKGAVGKPRRWRADMAFPSGYVALLGGLRGDRDMHDVPALDRSNSYPGVLLHAQALRTILTGTPPWRPGLLGVALILALSTALVALLVGRLPGPAWGLAGTVVMMLAWFALGFVLYRSARIMLPAKAMALGCICAFAMDTWRRVRDQRSALAGFIAEVDKARDTNGPRPESGIDTLPYVIAGIRAGVERYPGGKERVERLIDVAEVTIKTLAAILAAELRLRSESKWSSRLARLERPSLGHYWELARTVADGLSGDPASATVPELVALLSNRQNRRRIDRLVELRNSIRGHRSLLPPRDYQPVLEALEADVDALLGQLGFLVRYPICLVRGMGLDGERLLAEVHVWTGPSTEPRHEKLPVQSQVKTDELVVISRGSGATLELAPLLARVHCAQHKEREFGFANGVTRARKPRYLGYAKGCLLETEETWPT